jgi:hypothetical protein
MVEVWSAAVADDSEATSRITDTDDRVKPNIIAMRCREVTFRCSFASPRRSTVDCQAREPRDLRRQLSQAVAAHVEGPQSLELPDLRR